MGSPVLTKLGLTLLLVSVVWVQACSTTTQEIAPPIAPLPPPYTKVPHPEGLDQADLIAIFAEEGAPDPKTLRTCDEKFEKLRSLTLIKGELEQGYVELVKNDPVHYHWCFYGKLFLMEQDLKEAVYLEDRQKTVLKAYSFLTPISKAFQEEFHDSRYKRWAVTRYRQMSQIVFFRKLELSTEGAKEIEGTYSPFGYWRAPRDPSRSVLEKYGLLDAPPPVGPAPETAPLSAAPKGVPVPKSAHVNRNLASTKKGGPKKAVSRKPAQKASTSTEDLDMGEAAPSSVAETYPAKK